MTLEGLTSVFRALGERSVRFIVVGGVAVNVQGYHLTGRYPKRKAEVFKLPLLALLLPVHHPLP